MSRFAAEATAGTVVLGSTWRKVYTPRRRQYGIREKLTAMTPFGNETPYCKRCDYELANGRDTCPKCQFSPRNRGLRVALGLLMVVVLGVSVMMVLPSVGRYLVPVVAVSFLLSVLAFVVSFVATPYRFGSLFLRL